ncbi:MAG: FkbM family methyltransferase [Candidatus Roizmanbacteria bacterium]
MKKVVFLISFLSKHLLRGISVYKHYFAVHFALFVKRKDIVVELYDGAKYYIRSGYFDITTLDQIYIEHVYDPSGYELKPDDVVFDIGAYIGDYSVYAARKATAGMVYAFEPVVETFALLEKNCTLNRLDNLRRFNIGLSDSDRTVEFRTGSDISQPGASAYDLEKMGYSTDEYKKTKVSLRDINSFIKEQNIKKINVLKIDCEGEEFALMYHLDKDILLGCRMCMIEYHNIHHDPTYTGSHLAAYLKKNGFSVDIEAYNLAQNTGMIYAKNKLFI